MSFEPPQAFFAPDGQLVTAAQAIRFLHGEAQRCRDFATAARNNGGNPREVADRLEMFCLLLPALLRVYQLQPLDAAEALAFQAQLHATLRTQYEVAA